MTDSQRVTWRAFAVLVMFVYRKKKQISTLPFATHTIEKEANLSSTNHPSAALDHHLFKILPLTFNKIHILHAEPTFTWRYSITFQSYEEYYGRACTP